jgi:hypothetical protein
MAQINKEIHTPNTKMGHGDNHGTAIRNKTARITDISGGVQNKIKMTKTPKSLA